MFCSFLIHHHTGEDGGAFPVVAEQFPALRPVLAELMRDHELVTATLRRLEELFTATAATDPDQAEAAQIAAEVDELSVLLETHFLYEEKKLVTVLNSLVPRQGTADDDDLLRAIRLPRPDMSA